MTVPDQVFIREAPEDSDDEGREEIDAEVRSEEAEEEENGESPSHLPFAPSSELPDMTTVDPSYIISLIRKLLPNNHEIGFIDEENVWEDSGCILWDLSASRAHAEFMVDNFMLEVLIASIHASKSPRITEICLGILGNLACHDVSSNTMASKDGLIETVVNQLYLDDSPILSETFRLLTVALQGFGSMLWAKALLSEQTCLRIIWIIGNTLNTVLLEKSIDFLLTVINTKEVANVLLQPWIKLGLPNLVVNLLSCEMNNLDDGTKQKRTSFLDLVLCLVEPLSSMECGLEMIFPNEELCRLVCRVIKLPDKYEYTSSCVSAVVIIANLLVDKHHIASQLSQGKEASADFHHQNLLSQLIVLPSACLDHEFLRGLLETIPYAAADDPQARGALWCILERLLARIAEVDIDISSLCRLVSVLLEKSSLIMDDLDGHYVEDSSSLNGANNGAVAGALLRIGCIIDGWIGRRNEKIEETAIIVDSEAKAERLLSYCKKYSSELSAPSVQE